MLLCHNCFLPGALICNFNSRDSHFVIYVVPVYLVPVYRVPFEGNGCDFFVANFPEGVSYWLNCSRGSCEGFFQQFERVFTVFSLQCFFLRCFFCGFFCGGVLSACLQG